PSAAIVSRPVGEAKTRWRPSGDQAGWPPRASTRVAPVTTSTTSTFRTGSAFGFEDGAGHSIAIERPPGDQLHAAPLWLAELPSPGPVVTLFNSNRRWV